MTGAEQLGVLVLPFLACLVLVGIHGYLGLHVLARKVIFVDLAMAQIAALGGTVAFLLGHDLRSPVAYGLSLGFTLAGAAVFAATRTRHEKIPQEATIGLVYAIASAAALLLADQSAGGGEHLKALLSGSIVWVGKWQLLKTALIYGAVGAFHFAFRRQFLAISFDPEKARAEGMRVRLWDFLFYLSFGLVITSSVAIAGVLLVFCFLIAPAVAAALFAESVRSRLAIAWGVGTGVSALGLAFSFDRPSGPTIICFFAGFLALAAAGKAVAAARNRPRALGIAAGVAAALVLAGTGLVRLLRHAEPAGGHGDATHSHGETPEDLVAELSDPHPAKRSEAAHQLGLMGHRPAVPKLIALLRDRDAGVKEQAAEALGALGATEAIPALRLVAAAPEDDEWVPLQAAAALCALGDRTGVERLLALARDAEAHRARVAALSALKKAVPGAGAPPGEDDGLPQLAAWWKAHGARAAFDRATKTWRESP